MNKIISILKSIFSFMMFNGTSFYELSSTEVSMLMVDRKKKSEEEKKLRDQLIEESKRRREQIRKVAL